MVTTKSPDHNITFSARVSRQFLRQSKKKNTMSVLERKKKNQTFSGNVLGYLFRTFQDTPSMVPDRQSRTENTEEEALAQGLLTYKSPVRLRPRSSEFEDTMLCCPADFPSKPSQTWLTSQPSALTPTLTCHQRCLQVQQSHWVLAP